MKKISTAAAQEIPNCCKLQFVFYGTIFGAIRTLIHRQTLLAPIPLLW